MHRMYRFLFVFFIWMHVSLAWNSMNGQNMPPRYATLELFTNTPCPICASQNPGLFNRLQAFEGQYHLISFYPGKPYASCIFYQFNIPENTSRWQFYTGELFGTPTVAINGIDFKTSNGVTNTVLDAVTGDSSWLYVKVEETSGMNRTVDITLTDVVGSSLTIGKLFAVIVEKEVVYNAPNGETGHHNVFRKFLGPVAGEDVDLISGTALKTYSYNVDEDWVADQVYVIAWLMDPGTKEILNSGTRFDQSLSATYDITKKYTEVHAYPNPAKDQVLIELPGNMNGMVNVNIFSPSGSVVKRIQEHEVTSSSFIIPVHDMLSGLYYIIIDAKDTSFMGKIVVE
ncbi:MAG TPA: T9SS type A sorting domain-containing protein [Saprospiraceae bacterium]|nr:T9SS type A sorting domain-containing protein [Saprospiraceae bacterium]